MCCRRTFLCLPQHVQDGDSSTPLTFVLIHPMMNLPPIGRVHNKGGDRMHVSKVPAVSPKGSAK